MTDSHFTLTLLISIPLLSGAVISAMLVLEWIDEQRKGQFDE